MATASFYKQLEAQDGALPPVEDWNPPLSGEMDCTIRKDGSWLIDGSELQNLRLQRLLSKVLKLEGEEYYLVSPVEKWRITVEDQPFMVVEISMIDAGTDDQVLQVRSNVEEQVNIGDEHVLSTSLIPGQDDTVYVPCARVRRNLSARFNRNTHLQLAEYLEPGETDNEYRLLSSGHVFTLRF